MQEKVIFDTNIYIGVFNQGLYQDEIVMGAILKCKQIKNRL